jgi:hypothetical protein
MAAPIRTQNVKQTVSAATAQGEVTVSDATQFWPGARAILSKAGQPDLEVQILRDVLPTTPGTATNKLVIRAVDSKFPYGGSDVSLYATGSLWQPEQVAFPDLGRGIVPRVPGIFSKLV